MYRLIVVDDEEIIRGGLCQCVDWASLGFEVAADFEDGSEALEYLSEHSCDVVMTDIMMSRVNGLELARQIHEEHPEIKVLLLSGYQEFEYAKQAMQYGVSDYLLKPFRSAEIRTVFENLRRQLDEERAKSRELYQSLRENTELAMTVKNNFFKALLSGQIGSEEELEWNLSLLGLDRELKDCPVFLYTATLVPREGSESRGEETDRADGDIGGTEETGEGSAISRDVFDEYDRIELLLRHRLQQDGSEYIFYLLPDAPSRCSIVAIAVHARTLDAAVNCTQRVQALSRELVPQAGKTAKIRLVRSLLTLRSLVGQAQRENFSAQTVEDWLNESRYISLMSRYKRFLVRLNNTDGRGVEELLRAYMAELTPSGSGGEGDLDMPFLYGRFLFKGLLSSIAASYSQSGRDLLKETQGRFDSLRLLECENYRQLYDSAKEMLLYLCSFLHDGEEDTRNYMIERIQQYIRERLDRDISSEELAGIAHMNPSYFGRYFKKNTGEFLSEYILRLRIERAIELLREGNHKVNDISRMVGFSNPKYFYFQFKKSTGYTTTEYCRYLLHQDGLPLEGQTASVEGRP